MKLLFLSLLLALFSISCAKGYKEGDPLTGEQLALAQEATKMLNRVNDLDGVVPSAISKQWDPFVENVRLFDNACQRLSCNSLEARNDFNHLRYYAVQLDKVLTQKTYPEIYPKWIEIRKDYVDSIGRQLGYRIEYK